jgi:agmatinase
VSVASLHSISVCKEKQRIDPDYHTSLSCDSGKNPLTLVEPPFLAADAQINLQTPAGDAIFAGLGTFGHLPFGACLSPITTHIPYGSEELAPGDNFDVAIIGMPFDTAVSFRPGARFGPSGIRHNSKRMSKFRGYNVPLGLNVYESGQKILDCGDIPVTAFDNTLALQQMEQGYLSLLHRPVNTTHVKRQQAATGTEESLDTPLYTKTGKLHPKMITLGGDHTLVLPVLRALNTAYGPVAVIHFDR